MDVFWNYIVGFEVKFSVRVQHLLNESVGYILDENFYYNDKFRLEFLIGNNKYFWSFIELFKICILVKTRLTCIIDHQFWTNKHEIVLYF